MMKLIQNTRIQRKGLPKRSMLSLILLTILIVISTVSKTYGQTRNIDLYQFVNKGNTTIDDDNNTDTEALIDEFKQIMLIPANERTAEEWNRAIEIIFTIYHGKDLTSIFNELEAEIETQKKLKQELDSLRKQLNFYIAKEKQLVEDLTKLQHDYELISKELSPNYLGYHFYPYITAGFTSGIGANVGAGFIVPVTDRIIIGAGGLWHIDTSNLTKYFSVNFIFGWGF